MVSIVFGSHYYAFEESEEIKSPEDCAISTTNGYVHFITCPDLRMEMETYYIRNNFGDDFIENRSLIQCSTNSSPYKYLPYMKSKRNSLKFENCQLPEHGSFGDGWPKLEFLKFINFADIRPLKREYFSGLFNLLELQLSISSSHEMPDDIFSDLTKLRVLRLYVKLANKNIFKNLKELETLEITIRSPESSDNFDTSEMKDLPELKTLQLTDSFFTRLTKQFFEGCLNIENLEINFNNIDLSIDGNAFEDLTNLRNLELSFNQLTSLPDGLFSRNINLEKVRILFSNNLRTIPSAFFSNLPNLRGITINCKLTSIPNDLIRGTANLELLDLQFNGLTSIPRDLLQNHLKLKTIKLDGNNFKDTSTDLFDNKAPLTEISFQYVNDGNAT